MLKPCSQGSHFFGGPDRGVLFLDFQKFEKLIPLLEHPDKFSLNGLVVSEPPEPRLDPAKTGLGLIDHISIAGIGFLKIQGGSGPPEVEFLRFRQLDLRRNRLFLDTPLRGREKIASAKTVRINTERPFAAGYFFAGALPALTFSRAFLTWSLTPAAFSLRAFALVMAALYSSFPIRP
jgi:hypothetical protein